MTRTVVLTGASDGIGAAAAARLAADHRLVLVGRNPDKTHAVAERVGADAVFVADFAVLDQVRELAARIAERYDRIDVLANNAGGLFSGPTITGDGVELTFQVNHLAPFLLTELLRPRFTPDTAVVNTSSIAARLFSSFRVEDLDTSRRYRPERAYGNAKLANILHTKGLHARGIRSVAFHPGNVATSFASDTTSPLRWVYTTVLNRSLITPEAGGSTLEFFIRSDAWTSGEYYGSAHKPGRTSRKAADPALAEQLWTGSERLLGR
ncbi:SDR family NAD(P)-dependent oxidoreductase [Cellulomonas sp. RIT-PI-Y]|uniref:SDR family NAD(P)-dependent oxidoreductase n=1 Tax=Cellulomonas sp. RIT-PI-Y TaxID=3035297 RepID=UPI0021D9510D|nr:SDR family NAD(P)-dependent oxidoreductase [Cellulomonas sp. RIT-PI-Y]